MTGLVFKRLFGFTRGDTCAFIIRGQVGASYVP